MQREVSLCDVVPVVFTPYLPCPLCEVGHMNEWCQNNNLTLNVSKAEELFVDIRRGKPRIHEPAFIDRSVLKEVNNVKILVCNSLKIFTWAQPI